MINSTFGRRTAAIIALLLLAVCGPKTANAQHDYPIKPITQIVGFAAGGSPTVLRPSSVEK
jgi:tripartite-type tricarboxylate transporter receptor subunit TctC